MGKAKKCHPVQPLNPYVTLAGMKQFGLAADGSDIRDVTAAIEHLRKERNDAVMALLPFALLYEGHVDPDTPDSTGIIFPGSKVAVCVKDLRTAHKIVEGKS